MNADELFNKHQPALLRYLTRYTGDPEVAADATQHAYLKLVESPPRFENRISLSVEQYEEDLFSLMAAYLN